jgi:hypothetical protein
MNDVAAKKLTAILQWALEWERRVERTQINNQGLTPDVQLRTHLHWRTMDCMKASIRGTVGLYEYVKETYQNEGFYLIPKRVSVPPRCPRTAFAARAPPSLSFPFFLFVSLSPFSSLLLSSPPFLPPSFFSLPPLFSLSLFPLPLLSLLPPLFSFFSPPPPPAMATLPIAADHGHRREPVFLRAEPWRSLEHAQRHWCVPACLSPAQPRCSAKRSIRLRLPSLPALRLSSSSRC